MAVTGTPWTLDCPYSIGRGRSAVEKNARAIRERWGVVRDLEASDVELVLGCR